MVGHPVSWQHQGLPGGPNSPPEMRGAVLGFGFEEPDAGVGQAVAAHMASGDGPLVVLFSDSIIWEVIGL